MKKIVYWLKENSFPLLIGFFVLFILVQCSNNSTQKIINKNLVQELDSVKTELRFVKDNIVTKEEIKSQNKKMMFEFLIYEDDVDKGKISLSEIKDQISK